MWGEGWMEMDVGEGGIWREGRKEGEKEGGG